MLPWHSSPVAARALVEGCGRRSLDPRRVRVAIDGGALELLGKAVREHPREKRVRENARALMEFLMADP